MYWIDRLLKTRFRIDAIQVIAVCLTKPSQKPMTLSWYRFFIGGIIRLRFNDCRNPQFGFAVHLIRLTQVVGYVLLSWLCQVIKLHLHLPKPLHAPWYHCGDCAHHPAGVVILTQLAQLCILIILIFHILLIVRTAKIAQTVSDIIQHLLRRCFGRSGCHSRVFSFPHIFLLLLNCYLCILNSPSCHSRFSLNIILDPFQFILIPWNVRFSSFLHRRHLSGWQADQCCKG